MSTSTIPAQRTTRRPTGLPSWPILLLAGGEKSGKSYGCALATGSDLIGRTFWIGIGEDDPDEYGAVKGADFEIVPHDGTYRDILAAIEWACAQPEIDGKPTLVVVDSMTRLWDLVCEMAQATANERVRRQNRGKETDVEGQITMDLWNTAKDRWGGVMDVLRAHRGPVLVTARLEEVVVVVGGKPTQERTLKVKAEKSLPYDVGGIVQMPERGKAYLTGVRTTRMNVPERLVLTNFTVDKLWRDLGLADGAVRDRAHSGVNKANTDPIAAQRVLLLNQIKTAVSDDVARLNEIAADWGRSHDGQSIAETRDIGGLQLLCDDLAGAAERMQAEQGRTVDPVDDQISRELAERQAAAGVQS